MKKNQERIVQRCPMTNATATKGSDIQLNKEGVLRDMNGHVIHVGDWVNILSNNRKSYRGPYKIYKAGKYLAYSFGPGIGYTLLRGDIKIGCEVEIVEEPKPQENRFIKLLKRFII